MSLGLRSYEIGGTALEDIGFRTRYGFYKDIDGLLFKYEPERVQIKAFRGRPLQNDLPPLEPFLDFRRPNLIEAIETTVSLVDDYQVGGIYLRNNAEDEAIGSNRKRSFWV